MNGQKDTDQDLNGKGIDEKEDFLQQIRTKVSHHFFLSFACFPRKSHFVYVLERFIFVCEMCINSAKSRFFSSLLLPQIHIRFIYLEHAWLY